MIKFFKNIRRDALIQKKVKKYLIYAMGEIILVVIGILIALSINNWDDEKDKDNFQIQLLLSFKNGLETDLINIDYNIAKNNESRNSIDSLLSYLENRKSYENFKLGLHFSQMMLSTRFVHSMSAFETLKSKGITTISNDSLRNQIIEVYDSEYRFFLGFESVHNDYLEYGMRNIFPTRFRESHRFDLYNADFPGKLNPLNFDNLKTDQEFLFYLMSLKNRAEIFVESMYLRLRGKICELLIEIDKETKFLAKND